MNGFQVSCNQLKIYIKIIVSTTYGKNNPLTYSCSTKTITGTRSCTIPTNVAAVVPAPRNPVPNNVTTKLSPAAFPSPIGTAVHLLPLRVNTILLLRCTRRPPHSAPSLLTLKTAVHPRETRLTPMFTPRRAVLRNHPVGEARSSCAAQKLPLPRCSGVPNCRVQVNPSNVRSINTCNRPSRLKSPVAIRVGDPATAEHAKAAVE